MSAALLTNKSHEILNFILVSLNGDKIKKTTVSSASFGGTLVVVLLLYVSF